MGRKSKLPQQQYKALEMLLRGDATVDELSKAMECHYSDVNKKLSDLVQSGMLSKPNKASYTINNQLEAKNKCDELAKGLDISPRRNEKHLGEKKIPTKREPTRVVKKVPEIPPEPPKPRSDLPSRPITIPIENKVNRLEEEIAKLTDRLSQWEMQPRVSGSVPQADVIQTLSAKTWGDFGKWVLDNKDKIGFKKRLVNVLEDVGTGSQTQGLNFGAGVFEAMPAFLLYLATQGN